MLRLDRSMPYGEVLGMSALMYEQNGIMFDAHGFPAEVKDGVVVPLEIAEPVVDTPAPSPVAGIILPKMSNEQLKQQVAIYGGKWEGRERAIRFLQGDL